MTSSAINAQRCGFSRRLELTTGLMLSAGLVASLAASRSASGWQHQTVLAAGLLVLTVIAILDMRTLRAPNRIVYPTSIALIVGFASLGIGPALDAFAGGALSFGTLLLCVILGRGSMGYGDAKVGFICGTLVGPAGILPMLFITFFAGGCLAAVAMTTGRRARRDVVAFTPFLLIGVLLTLWLATADRLVWYG